MIPEGTLVEEGADRDDVDQFALDRAAKRIKSMSTSSTLAWQRFRSLLSGLTFAGILWFLFRSWFLVGAVTIGLALHELGHIVPLQRWGIAWDLRFGLYGAATISVRAQRRALSHFENSLVHLAGPASNLLAALLLLLVYGCSGTNSWLEVCNLNALLALINLLPFADLSDGSKFIERLFASLEEDVEYRWLWGIGAWILSLLWIAVITRADPLRLVMTGVFVVWAMVDVIRESGEDDPGEAASPRAMTHIQAGALVAAMFVGLGSSTALVMLTPFWFDQQDALRVLQGFSHLWRFLAASPGTAALIGALGVLMRLFLRSRSRSKGED
jgi:hypothetical protein